MRKLAFMFVYILFFYLNLKAGVFGRVVGKVDGHFKMNTTGKIYIATEVIDGRKIRRVRLDVIKEICLVNRENNVCGEIEMDGTFFIVGVPPGRYLVLVNRGLVIKDEIEVEPDVTTVLNLTIENLKDVITKPVPKKSFHIFHSFDSQMKHLPLIHPDKTFSGFVWFTDDEVRARSKPLPLEILKIEGFGGIRVNRNQ